MFNDVLIENRPRMVAVDDRADSQFRLAGAPSFLTTTTSSGAPSASGNRSGERQTAAGDAKHDHIAPSVRHQALREHPARLLHGFE